jgi:D-beta-D-heptose 7-phosphate kinase/D-beta-D-heptose 1-phosphate adenosyltransferase
MRFSLSKFNKARILVIGDIMLDRYVWGKVSRISPEAPVPVVKVQRTSETLGGAGNVANNLSALGCLVTVIGICGRDTKAASLKQLLSEKSIRYTLVEDATGATITKTRIIAGKQQVMRLDEETVHTPSASLLKQVNDHVAKELEHCHVVILSDYGKGVLNSHELVQQIIGMVNDYHRPVLVDPKAGQWERYENATCITPNTSELESVSGIALESDDDLLVAEARQIRSRYGLKWLMVTRGAKGICLVGPKGEVMHIPAQALEVYDVSGAGDTVVATLAAALASGATFKEAARVANTAAGIVVGKFGTQPILHSELSTALQFSHGPYNYPFSAVKMVAQDAASAKVHQWRNAGDRIVFTNGCFDLLHPGHISLLYQARALGDRLIVGLNTDASVRRLKGPERPVLCEQDRAAMLSALACVDLVVCFDEDTPLDIIKALEPDTLVKGSDYKLEDVVGKDVVETYGGSVKLVELVKGYSTSQLTSKVF